MDTKTILEEFKNIAEKVDAVKDSVSEFRTDNNGRLSKLEERMENFKDKLSDSVKFSTLQVEVKKALEEHKNSCPNAKKNVFTVGEDTRKWITKLLILGIGLGAGVTVPQLMKLIGL